MIELDKSTEKPIYTPEEARKRGFSEEQISKIFGVGHKSSSQILKSLAKVIHYVTLRRP